VFLSKFDVGTVTMEQTASNESEEPDVELGLLGKSVAALLGTGIAALVVYGILQAIAVVSPSLHRFIIDSLMLFVNGLPGMFAVFSVPLLVLGAVVAFHKLA